MANVLKKLFTPSGKYNIKYNNYLIWSSFSTMIISIETAMSTNNMLNALDLGEENKAFNYIGKDIIGQLGGLVYMSKMSEKADKNPKKFLLYSNIIQQSSYLLMCSTSIVDPGYFLYIAGIANVFSNISFTGYGSVNAKCIQKLSSDNMGEMYAKITTVNTLTSSLGLGIGIGLCNYTDEYSRMFLIPFLGFLRVYSYNKAIKGII